LGPLPLLPRFVWALLRPYKAAVAAGNLEDLEDLLFKAAHKYLHDYPDDLKSISAPKANIKAGNRSRAVGKESAQESDPVGDLPSDDGPKAK